MSDDVVSVPRDLAERVLVALDDEGQWGVEDERARAMFAALVNPMPAVSAEMVEEVVGQYVELQCSAGNESYVGNEPDLSARRDVRCALAAALSKGVVVVPGSAGSGRLPGDADYEAIYNADEDGFQFEGPWVIMPEVQREQWRSYYDVILEVMNDRGLFPKFELSEDEVEVLAKQMFDELWPGSKRWSQVGSSVKAQWVRTAEVAVTLIKCALSERDT